MFMKFVLYNEAIFDPNAGELPQVKKLKQQICININRITEVQQSGKWIKVPVEPQLGEMVPNIIVDDFIDRPRRRQSREIFVIQEDIFSIALETGRSYVVVGKFDEFCEMLTNFRDKLESV